ncbi:MAG: trigger factor, partial [Symploca sp. SIO1C4]|nr:trigger factor [Symploca sp. SIO1C4]
ETMIEQEVDQILTQTAIQMESYGMDIKKLFTKETVQQMRERTRPDAINRLKQSLALEEISKRESLTVEPEAIDKKVEELMEQFSGQDVDSERVRNFVESDLLKEKAIQWLEEHATIELVPKGSLAVAEEETQSQVEASVSPQIDAAEQTIDVQAQESLPTEEASVSPQIDAAEQTIDVQAQESTQD